MGGVALTRPRADHAAAIAEGRISDDDLAAALARALDAPPLDTGSARFATALAPFAWGRV